MSGTVEQNGQLGQIRTSTPGDVLIETNKYQTPVTAELLNSYPQEVREQFMEFVSSVPFIRNLISTERKKAKDLPRDDKGRIIIDLANPHILENMDYFRQSALHFQKYGCYTKLKPNSNPNSPYQTGMMVELPGKPVGKVTVLNSFGDTPETELSYCTYEGQDIDEGHLEKYYISDK